MKQRKKPKVRWRTMEAWCLFKHGNPCLTNRHFLRLHGTMANVKCWCGYKAPDARKIEIRWRVKEGKTVKP